MPLFPFQQPLWLSATPHLVEFPCTKVQILSVRKRAFQKPQQTGNVYSLVEHRLLSVEEYERTYFPSTDYEQGAAVPYVVAFFVVFEFVFSGRLHLVYKPWNDLGERGS